MLVQVHFWTRLQSLLLEQLPSTILETVDLILEDTNPCSQEDQDVACLEDHAQDPQDHQDHHHVEYQEDQHLLEAVVTPDQCPDQVSVHPPA